MVETNFTTLCPGDICREDKVQSAAEPDEDFRSRMEVKGDKHFGCGYAGQEQQGGVLVTSDN